MGYIYLYKRFVAGEVGRNRIPRPLPRVTDEVNGAGPPGVPKAELAVHAAG